MAVITISRQLGSLGCEIARAAAHELGFRVLRRELLHTAAQKVGLPEIGLEIVDELGLFGLTSNIKQRKAYAKALEGVLAEEAATGNVVILGRAGQVLLQDFPQSLHIRMIAPIALRIERVAQVNRIPIEAARAQIEASDHYRERFLSRFFGVRIEDPQLYDLIINTGRLSVQQCASLIVEAARRL